MGNGGGGALTVKSSAPNGMLVLAGANTYAGGTTITNVTLLANNQGGSATGAGGVTVLAGGILAGMGGWVVRSPRRREEPSRRAIRGEP